MLDATGDVTRLLQRMRNGDARAVDSLIPLVTGELRALAKHYLRGERRNHTLQPTALVNEAYLRLAGDQARDWQNRAHFIGVTASVMRRILVDYARRTKAVRRGGGSPDKAPTSRLIAVEQAETIPIEELLTLDRALDQLQEMAPRQRQIVEMRYFGGLTLEETSEVLGVSVMTVRREWTSARAWLKSELRSNAGAPGK